MIAIGAKNSTASMEVVGARNQRRRRVMMQAAIRPPARHHTCTLSPGSNGSSNRENSETTVSPLVSFASHVDRTAEERCAFDNGCAGLRTPIGLLP